MDADTAKLEAEEAMEKAVAHTLQEFGGVRTGKATPSIAENIDIDVPAYGTKMKLKELAVISAPEPRLLQVSPFDPSTADDIARGIRESKLGINPAVDGKIIRLPFPELSGERRVELAKLVKQMAEEGRVRIRGARRDALDKCKALHKAGDISEDGYHDLETEIQGLTDRYVKQVDEHVAAKEADIMTV